MQGKVGEGQSMEFRGGKNRTGGQPDLGSKRLDEIGPLESKKPLEVKLATEEAENIQQ